MQDVVKLRYPCCNPKTTWPEAKVYEASDTSSIYRARGFVCRIDLTPEQLQLGPYSRCTFESIHGAATPERTTGKLKGKPHKSVSSIFI